MLTLPSRRRRRRGPCSLAGCGVRDRRISEVDPVGLLVDLADEHADTATATAISAAAQMMVVALTSPRSRSSWRGPARASRRTGATASHRTFRTPSQGRWVGWVAGWPGRLRAGDLLHRRVAEQCEEGDEHEHRREEPIRSLADCACRFDVRHLVGPQRRRLGGERGGRTTPAPCSPASCTLALRSRSSSTPRRSPSSAKHDPGERRATRARRGRDGDPGEGPTVARFRCGFERRLGARAAGEEHVDQVEIARQDACPDRRLWRWAACERTSQRRGAKKPPSRPGTSDRQYATGAGGGGTECAPRRGELGATGMAEQTANAGRELLFGHVSLDGLRSSHGPRSRSERRTRSAPGGAWRSMGSSEPTAAACRPRRSAGADGASSEPQHLGKRQRPTGAEPRITRHRAGTDAGAEEQQHHTSLERPPAGRSGSERDRTSARPMNRSGARRPDPIRSTVRTGEQKRTSRRSPAGRTSWPGDRVVRARGTGGRTPGDRRRTPTTTTAITPHRRVARAGADRPRPG